MTLPLVPEVCTCGQRVVRGLVDGRLHAVDNRRLGRDEAVAAWLAGRPLLRVDQHGMRWYTPGTVPVLDLFDATVVASHRCEVVR